MKYIVPCFLFLANDEFLSTLALVILAAIVLLDMWKAHEEVRKA
jgi:hypothetical protein